MTIYKGYKYRVKARTRIRQQFIKNAGACRFIWNKILSINEHRYYSGVPRLNYYEAWQLIAWMKQSEEYGWLKDANAESLQQCLMDLEKAYKNLFAGRAALSTGYGGRARAQRRAKGWTEQGDSRSGLGHVSAHAGVQVSLAWW